MTMFISWCNKIIEFGLIFLIVFTPLAFGTVHIWSITIMELVVIFLLTVWIAKLIASRHKLKNSKPSSLTLEFTKTPLNLPFLLFVCFILFQLSPLPPFAIKHLSPNTYKLYETTLPNYDTGGHLQVSNYKLDYKNLNFQQQTSNYRPLTTYSHATKMELLKFLSYIFVFFIIINNLRTRKQIEHLITAIIVVGTFISLFAIIQRVAHDKIYWFAQFTQAGYTLGPYVNRDHFAGYMEMVAPLAISLLVVRRLLFFKSSSNNSASWRIHLHKWADDDSQFAKTFLLFFVTIIIVAALFLSLSRGGIVSFLLSITLFVGFLLFTHGKRINRFLMILFITFSIFIIWLGIDPIITRMSTLLTPHEAILPRATLWKDSYQIFKDFPIFGSGLGTYQYIFPEYKRLVGGGFAMHAHNDYLEYLSDLGIFGFCLFFGMIIFFLVRCLRLWQQKRHPYVRWLSFAGFVGIVSILFHSSVDFNLHVPANTLLFFIILALINNILHLRNTEDGEIVFSPSQIINLNPRFKFIFFISIIAIFAFLSLSIIRLYTAERCFKAVDVHELWTSDNLKLLKRAVKFDPGNSQYQYYLGKAYEELALKEPFSLTAVIFLSTSGLMYQKAINLEPSNAWYHLNLGWVYSEQGFKQLSHKEMCLAKILDPKNESIARYLSDWEKLNIKNEH